MDTTQTYRAMWPIVDEQRSFIGLCREAQVELGPLMQRARVMASGPGRFYAAHASQVPGSGRVTDWVLVYECPAKQLPPRTIPTTVLPESVDVVNRRQVLEDLDAREQGISEACRVTGTTRSALQKWCGRWNLHHLYRSLSAREVHQENGYTRQEAS